MARNFSCDSCTMLTQILSIYRFTGTPGQLGYHHSEPVSVEEPVSSPSTSSKNPSRDHRHLQTHKKRVQTNMLTDKVVCLRPPRNRWWRSWWAWDTSRNPLFFDDAASGYTIRPSISETENAGSRSGGGRRRRARPRRGSCRFDLEG